MASFDQKIADFLKSAVGHNIIEKPQADALVAFARSSEHEHKGWFSLTSALGGLGALVLCFGVILVISANWYAIGDLTKLSVFLILLGGSHFTGLYLSGKGYSRTAAGLHFLGAGLFITGVGLIAQIFNLYSPKGESFLIWAAMITPFALLLRSGPITLLCLVAFSIWGNIYISYLLLYGGWISISVFNMAVCIVAAVGGLLLKHKGSPLSPFLQVPGMVGVVFWLFFFGFSHNFGPSSFNGGNIQVTLLPLIPAIIMIVYLWFKNFRKTDERYFLAVMTCTLLTIVVTLLVLTYGVDENAYFKHFSFGRTEKIYFFPLAVSIVAWVAYFGLCFWGVVYGALQQKRWMLNCSIILIGIGIFTRFIDLMGDMMDTGSMFILCGLLLVAIGFVLEKWRRKLIAEQARVRGTI